MNKNWCLTFTMLILLGICLSAQKPADLAGTWLGEALLEGMEPNELTLVLDHKDGKFTGHMTGQYGTLNESPVTEAVLEKDAFSFSVMAEGPQGEVAVNFKLKVSDNTMAGDFDIPDMGMAGTWEAKKQ